MAISNHFFSNASNAITNASKRGPALHRARQVYASAPLQQMQRQYKRNCQGAESKSGSLLRHRFDVILPQYSRLIYASKGFMEQNFFFVIVSLRPDCPMAHPSL